MVTYEITAVVDAVLADKYEKYMTGRHIPDLLATGHFTSATFSRNGDRYRIRYEALHRSEVDQYLESHATSLRADFYEHFPAGVELLREIWEVLAELDAPKASFPAI